jgi:hypothetical protein
MLVVGRLTRLLGLLWCGLAEGQDRIQRFLREPPDQTAKVSYLNQELGCAT